MVVASDLRYLNLNPKELAKYIAMCSESRDWRRCKVQHLIPERKFSRGPRPGVGGGGVQSGSTDAGDEQWVHPAVEATELDKKRLLGLVVEIGLRLHSNSTLINLGANSTNNQMGVP